MEKLPERVMPRYNFMDLETRTVTEVRLSVVPPNDQVKQYEAAMADFYTHYSEGMPVEEIKGIYDRMQPENHQFLEANDLYGCDGRPLKKLLNLAGIIFKGPGFYVTDKVPNGNGKVQKD